MARKDSLIKKINYKKLSKLTSLPKAIIHDFVKDLIKKNNNDQKLINFYINFLIFLHEENLYNSLDLIVNFYKKKELIDFKPFLEDSKLLTKFKNKLKN